MSRLTRRRIDELYRSHGHLVLRRARQVLGDDSEAREVLQEVFASLLARPSQFGGRSAITTWLYSATTHRCLNRIRDRSNRERLLRERVRPAVSASAPARAEQVAAARELLAALPDELGRVAVYYYFDELTQEEIAELLGCSRRHVGNLLERIRAFATRQQGIA